MYGDVLTALQTAPRSPRHDAARLRITVLRGGPSAEREVSLNSGRGVAEALRASGHEVFEADISPDDLSALDRAADVVFSVLHGTFGEDGTLQRIMEQRGLRFVGSGSKASALAIDKAAAKALAIKAGISTPAFHVLTRQTASRDLPTWSGPVVVKPVDQGSSVLTSIIRTPDELAPAVEAVIDRYGRALVEQFIDGDELTVGILGDEALPTICIRPRQAFYDYHAKYIDDATEYLFDAGHPRALLEKAQADSRRFFGLAGCRHLARVDWMLDRTGTLWFLEINTLPGFTSHSLLPKAAARVGISYAELCDRLARMALEADA